MFQSLVMWGALGRMKQTWLITGPPCMHGACEFWDPTDCYREKYSKLGTPANQDV